MEHAKSEDDRVELVQEHAELLAAAGFGDKALEAFSTVASLEDLSLSDIPMLRLLLDRGGLYDRAKPFWKDIVDVTLVCACGPAGGGRNPLTPRFVRHNHVVAFPQPSQSSLRTILSGVFTGFVEGAAREVRECVKPLVEASIALYTEVATTLRPIPAKPHYTFNLRDLSKVAQGVLRAKANQLSGRKALLSLWWHEAMRTFCDRPNPILLPPSHVPLPTSYFLQVPSAIVWSMRRTARGCARRCSHSGACTGRRRAS